MSADPPSSQPTLSRRQLLGAGGFAALGAWYVRPSEFTDEQSLDSTVPDNAWPMAGRTPSRSGYAPASDAPTNEVRAVWQTDVGDPGFYLSATVRDDTVYTTTRNELVALDAERGTERWRFGKEFVQGGPVAIEGGACYSAGVSLYAVAGGRAEWKFKTTSSFSEILPVGNTIFIPARVGSSDGLVALDAGSGIPRWKATTEWIPLAYANDVLVGTGGSGVVVGLDAKTGEKLWELSRVGLPGNISSPLRFGPVIANGTLFGGTETLYAVDLQAGSVQWSADAVGPWMASDGDAVYRARDGHVVALNASDGSMRWETSANALTVVSGLAVTDDAIYVGVDSGVVALDTETGDELFAFRSDSTAGGGPPAVVGERVYVGIGETIVALEEA
ncbi:Outer membrane protein assembly factor BamB, contains PQQ-like beta-propeller repeat [Haladaptatus litoreus]|uniref:Outer membrane protein assembly factor BamB, contains PQQ-like beta-propeller repeat n=1 Tax=Haladaptatus litoreus TaxID=553468 RepID=A0A1N7E3F2_9EURY|nr:PQQ-binding-like beta-propeller repeat protein [Haladaptatus litoreus]SIR82548.1 Outer membrane protein assembly factor BamB, contains PQQ-like beta-propeller repeat [Haladaptatus litoreus]